MIAKATDTFAKLKNPFTFGGPVRGEGKFFGREEEIRLICNTLENVPLGQKQDLVIMGPRRIGKSSLLYRLVDLLTPTEDFVPVYVDVQNIKPRNIRLLFLKTLLETQEGYNQRNLPMELPDFKTLGSENISADLEFFTFDEDMTRLNNLIAARDLPRLVLIFDEVELLWEFGGRDTLDWLRSLIQKMPYCIFVVAGSEYIYSLTQDYGSPFYNIFKTVELHPLTIDAARQLIEIPAAEIGLEISPTEVGKILNYAGNSPYFIQGIAHYLVEELNLQKRRRAYTKDVDKVIKQSIEHLSAQFAYIWGRVSQVQRVILYALAKSRHPQTADALMSNLPQSELLKTYIQSKRKHQETFDDLVQQQVLKVEKGNRFWFIVPLFTDWILSKVDDEEVIKFATVPEVTTPEDTWPRVYDTAVIRQLLADAFNDQELRMLTFDYFRPVYESLSSSMSKAQLIQLLLEYTYRHEQLDKLLEIVREHNPSQYSRFSTRLGR